MTSPNTSLQTTVAEREVQYVPFGADPADPTNAIKLSVSIIKQFIAVKTRSGAVCDDAQALKFVALCKARKLNPFEGDAYLIGFDTQDGPQFSLVTAHQAFLKRAEVHHEFDGMESGVIVKTKDGKIEELQGDFYTNDETLLGGWAKVHFKTRKWPMYKKLRLADFAKSFGVWKTNPGGMIVKCAEADALRSSFPTMMGGMLLQQEVEANTVTASVLPPTQSRLVHRAQTALPNPTVATGPGEAPPSSGSPPSTEVQTSPAVEEPKAKRPGRPPKGSPPPATAPVDPPQSEPPPSAPVQEGPDPFAEGTGTPAEPPLPAQPEQIQPIEPHDDPSEMTTRIRNALRALNLSETTLVEWCRGKDLMSDKQTFISLMSSAKLRSICESWPAVVEEMKAP